MVKHNFNALLCLEIGHVHKIVEKKHTFKNFISIVLINSIEKIVSKLDEICSSESLQHIRPSINSKDSMGLANLKT